MLKRGVCKMKNKFLSILLCTVLLLNIFVAVASAEGENGELILGDVDRNGKVDTQDAREILKMTAGIKEADLTVADMNGDGIISIDDAHLALVKASNIGGVVIPDKNGDNFLSDDPENEFIKIIASTYNANPKSLVAIYSVPDTGTNYVLRFDSKNNYEKSANNLYMVYHIGPAPERTVSYTNGSLLNHNCSAAEGMLVFNLVKTQVMTQYPDYFK